VKRVVVTGLGMVNALGLDKESAFKGIIEGKCGIDHIELFDTEGQSVTIAGEIKGFDPLTVLDAKEAKKADRFIQLGLKAAAEAIEDANLPKDFNRDRFGVASASGIGGLPNIEKNSLVCGNRGNFSIFYSFISCQYVRWIYLYLSRLKRTKFGFCYCMCSRNACHR